MVDDIFGDPPPPTIADRIALAVCNKVRHSLRNMPAEEAVEFHIELHGAIQDACVAVLGSDTDPVRRSGARIIPEAFREVFEHIHRPGDGDTRILVMDAPGAGGASHRYDVCGIDMARNPATPEYAVPVSKGRCALVFQQGTVADHGRNGVTAEILLAIVADRLRSFQRGPFPSGENGMALSRVEEALNWLHQRTDNRVRRGVEGRPIA